MEIHPLVLVTILIDRKKEEIQYITAITGEGGEGKVFTFLFFITYSDHKNKENICKTL